MPRYPGIVPNLIKRPKPPAPPVMPPGKTMMRMKANPALAAPPPTKQGPMQMRAPKGLGGLSSSSIPPRSSKSVTGNPGTAAASKVRLSNIEAATRRGGFPVARPPMEKRTRIIGRGKGR